MVVGGIPADMEREARYKSNSKHSKKKWALQVFNDLLFNINYRFNAMCMCVCVIICKKFTRRTTMVAAKEVRVDAAAH